VIKGGTTAVGFGVAIRCAAASRGERDALASPATRGARPVTPAAGGARAARREASSGAGRNFFSRARHHQLGLVSSGPRLAAGAGRTIGGLARYGPADRPAGGKVVVEQTGVGGVAVDGTPSAWPGFAVRERHGLRAGTLDYPSAEAVLGLVDRGRAASSRLVAGPAEEIQAAALELWAPCGGRIGSPVSRTCRQGVLVDAGELALGVEHRVGLMRRRALLPAGARLGRAPARRDRARCGLLTSLPEKPSARARPECGEQLGSRARSRRRAFLQRPRDASPGPPETARWGAVVAAWTQLGKARAAHHARRAGEPVPLVERRVWAPARGRRRGAGVAAARAGRIVGDLGRRSARPWYAATTALERWRGSAGSRL